MRTRLLSLACSLFAFPALAADVAIGSLAPQWTFVGSDGRSYSHSQFAGKRGVVFAWFPKAFTPG